MIVPTHMCNAHCWGAAESVKKDKLFGTQPSRDWAVNTLIVY